VVTATAAATAAATTGWVSSAGPVEERGWPLRPLLDASGLTATALGRRLGVGGATVTRAAQHGLTDQQADEWAIRLGLHPLMVWGWAWIDPAAQARGRPAYARIAAVLRHDIARGVLAPGERLPSVAALAARFDGGHRTVTQALDELRGEGLIVGPGLGHVGSLLEVGAAGCVVCAQPIPVGDEHYPHHPACPLATRGWCDCDDHTHPECCPDCAGGAP
jgi:hypothetical protein